MDDSQLKILDQDTNMLDIQIQGILAKIKQYQQSNKQLNEEFHKKFAFNKLDPIQTQNLQNEI